MPRRFLILILALLPLVISPASGRARASGPPIVTRTLALGGDPVPAAVDTPDHRVFVIEGVHRRLYVLDSRDGRLIANVALPGGAQPTAVAVDSRSHHVLVGAAVILPRQPGAYAPQSIGWVFVLDGRTLAILARTQLGPHQEKNGGNVPAFIAMDRARGHALAVCGNVRILTLANSDGRIVHWGYTTYNPTGAVFDPETNRLFTTYGGGDITGQGASVYVTDATRGALLRRMMVAALPPGATGPPLGEVARLAGLDRVRERVFVLATRVGAGMESLVELNAGGVVSVRARYFLPGTGPGVVDRQLGRVYVAVTTRQYTPFPTRLIMLSAGTLQPLHTLDLGGAIEALGVDIHAHRLLAADSHGGVVRIVDTWSGRLLGTAHVARPVGGANAASILVSQRTHRAFLGLANGTLTVLNSAALP